LDSLGRGRKNGQGRKIWEAGKLKSSWKGGVGLTDKNPIVKKGSLLGGKRGDYGGEMTKGKLCVLMFVYDPPRGLPGGKMGEKRSESGIKNNKGAREQKMHAETITGRCQKKWGWS